MKEAGTFTEYVDLPRLKAQRLALAQEITLAENKRNNLNESIDQRKKALARIDSQLALAGSDGPRCAMNAASCR